jgi:hypothetical protein
VECVTFENVKLEYIAEGSKDRPLIRLYSFDQQELLRLREAVEALSKETVQSTSLHEQQGIEPVDSCELILRSGARDLGVLQTGPAKFECVLTPDTWGGVKELIDPFVESSGGYQWLSEQGKISLLLSKSGSW